jgi:phytoene desaturase (3,4-didehydrolycopene-forming)
MDISVTGIWYPMGGFHSVVAAFEKIGKNRGAKYMYNKGVKQILIASKSGAPSPLDPQNADRATGVLLDDDTMITADIVVCNADLVWAYSNLLPSSSQASRLTEKAQTSSSFSFYWGLRSKVPQLEAHNVFISEEYQSSFDSIFHDHTLPSEPSFYIHVPSKMDVKAAPNGKEAITVLVPTGCIQPNSQQDFSELVRRARKEVIQTLENRLHISNFESLIELEVINTPQIWANKFNLHQGSILGLSHTGILAPFISFRLISMRWDLVFPLLFLATSMLSALAPCS